MICHSFFEILLLKILSKKIFSKMYADLPKFPANDDGVLGAYFMTAETTNA